jgi:predicted SnoaL-like aldol condensation-catalyzing enzyme
MKLFLAALIACMPLLAQTPATGVDDPETLVKSKDKKLEANKKLILDLFREVLEAHHTELIPKYLAADFIQHNPSAANGADALAAYSGCQCSHLFQSTREKTRLSSCWEESRAVSTLGSRQATESEDQLQSQLDNSGVDGGGGNRASSGVERLRQVRGGPASPRSGGYATELRMIH